MFIVYDENINITTNKLIFSYSKEKCVCVCVKYKEKFSNNLYMQKLIAQWEVLIKIFIKMGKVIKC
jgi:hypothetical protein